MSWKAPPLGALLLGRALIAAGRDLIAAGQRTHGLRALDSGRRVIEKSLDGHPHIALIQSDFAIAMALEALGRLDAASKRCALVRAATIRRAETGPEETRRLVACGRIDARLHRADPARRAFLAALANGEASGDDSLRFEMLLRLAALARLERRHSSETKLFERALPLLAPRMKRVHGLLTDVYSSLGSTQPSSAAARFAHAAVRTRDHYDSASRLQAIAAALSEPGNVPASRR